MQRRAGCPPRWSLGGEGSWGREDGEGDQGQVWRPLITITKDLKGEVALGQ